MKPTPKKPKRAGRVMWAHYSDDRKYIFDIGNSEYLERTHPVLVLPLSDVQQILDSRAAALVQADFKVWMEVEPLELCSWEQWKRHNRHRWASALDDARATLLADGVPAKLLKT